MFFKSKDTPDSPETIAAPITEGWSDEMKAQYGMLRTQAAESSGKERPSTAGLGVDARLAQMGAPAKEWPEVKAAAEALRELERARHDASNAPDTSGTAEALRAARASLEEIKVLADIGEAGTADVTKTKAEIARLEDELDRAHRRRRAAKIQEPILQERFFKAQAEAEARLFSETEADVKELRRLVERALEVNERVEALETIYGRTAPRWHTARQLHGKLPGLLRLWLENTASGKAAKS
jgi:hypothetical protein